MGPGWRLRLRCGVVRDLGVALEYFHDPRTVRLVLFHCRTYECAHVVMAMVTWQVSLDLSVEARGVMIDQDFLVDIHLDYYCVMKVVRWETWSLLLSFHCTKSKGEEEPSPEPVRVCFVYNYDLEMGSIPKSGRRAD